MKGMHMQRELEIACCVQEALARDLIHDDACNYDMRDSCAQTEQPSFLFSRGERAYAVKASSGKLRLMHLEAKEVDASRLHSCAAHTDASKWVRPHMGAAFE
jgi:hypothetical protein